MCFDIFNKFNKKNDLNNNYIIREMDCYMLISENFIKPYGVYNDLKIAKTEYDNLTKRYVNASLYKVDVNNNIVNTKNCYTLMYENKISYV